MLTVFAADMWAQGAEHRSSATDKAGPIYIHDEPVYKVGGKVSAPRPVYAPDPEYSEQGREAQLQGVCVLSMVVGTDGKPHDVQITRSLGLGLDEKAVEAIRTWRFEPAEKDGHAVAVQLNVETSFRVYSSGVAAGLQPIPQSDTQDSGVPNRQAENYPLLLDIRFPRGQRMAKGYVVTAEATMSGGGPLRKVTLTCGPKGKCFMLRSGNYRARWLDTSTIELIGSAEESMNHKKDKHKWEKAQFSATPIL